MKIIKDIDPKEWAELLDLEREALKLHHMPPALATYQLLVGKDPLSPRLVYRDISHSWVRNAYIQALNCILRMSVPTEYQFYGEGGLYIRTISGTDKLPDISTPYSEYIYVGSAGNTGKGPVAGTGNAAESFGAWQLDSIIPHGTGAGKMSYGLTSYSFSWDPASRRFKAEYVRNLLNSSGNTITVTEVGMHMYAYVGNRIDSYLAIRDLLETAINVANGEQLQITYTIYGPQLPTS